MKKCFALLVILAFVIIDAQGQSTPGIRSGNFNSGFYMKLGPSFPMKDFKETRYVTADNNPFDTLKTFESGKTGLFVDFGYLIYIGPSFANHILRAGIDADFLSVGYHPSHHVYTGDEKKIDYYYFFAGQKFGPMITVNPIDNLMIDLSYKIGYTGSGFDDDWGIDLSSQELSLGIRYRLIAFSINYDMQNINYNDFDDENPDLIHDQRMLKLMVGFKF